jgi:methyl-accepting chemotaxis protein
MDENVFRIVVTVGVVIASLAFVVQAGIMLALYKVTRKTQESAERFIGKMEPVMAKASPAIEKAQVVMEKAGVAIEKAGVAIEKAGPVIDRVGPAMDAAMPAIRKAGPILDEAKAVVAKAGTLVDRANEIATSTNLVIQDARPQIKQISQEALEITKLGREQVERVGDLLQDAGDKARARLDQIERSVDSTLGQVENVGGAIKRAALAPVREVNGLAAGISAAVATLMRHRRSSVDSATQDEEMFI